MFWLRNKVIIFFDYAHLSEGLDIEKLCILNSLCAGKCCMILCCQPFKI